MPRADPVAPSGWLALILLSPFCPLPASAQADTVPRTLSAEESGCVPSASSANDTVYDVGAVDQPVEPRRLPVEGMPFRTGEVLTGRSVFRFVVEASGAVDPCSIVLLEETAPSWTAAVVRELRHSRYRPARRAGRPVRQWVHQAFTYHSDGRIQKRR